MASTSPSAADPAVASYHEESPTEAASHKGEPRSCVRAAIRAIQVGCLVLIPILAVSLILFLAVFAIKCDGSGGFIITRESAVLCVSSGPHPPPASAGRETQTTRMGSTPANGTVVMTVTRVALISVSVLIVSFTAWICVWYQRYGDKGPTPTATETGLSAAEAGLAVAGGSGTQQARAATLEAMLVSRVNDYLAKEDLERLLGPEHSAAPAV